jgi:hypothetical protein
MSCQTKVLVQGASEVTKGVRTCLNRHLTSMGGSRCAMRMSMLLRNTHTSCSQAGRPPAPHVQNNQGGQASWRLREVVYDEDACAHSCW